ncbi:hypothetical protein [Aureimonas psammosilenae]|uniref:hypothetical protein n=1 Tax=Aureimonas psammosilenae TaxID=2495496 RepID=UPI001261315F|nr:hypothetical protein [Aureimonas psammosilenae]
MTGRSRKSADAPSPLEIVDWLTSKPDLVAMRRRFPDEWRALEGELADALSKRSVSALDRIVGLERLGVRGSDRKGRSSREQAMRLVRRRMAVLALERHAVSAAESESGSWLPRRISNALAKGLFFDARGNKKPVPLRVFRWTWPLVGGKGAFLTRMQTGGTYCFLSAELIDALASICRGRSCLEIAAGDGTLSRFLKLKDVAIVATDDRSWKGSIDYPPEVLAMDAATALEKVAPEVVLCSWPPPGNDFERFVFATPTVRTYLVIGSRHGFATGARDAYAAPTGFVATPRPDLEALVLPPEIGTEVLVFRRTT